jgi:drug/metabolite transporter (DMT)-like permease
MSASVMQIAVTAPDLMPALAVAVVALASGWPAYATLRRTRRGRARSAIAYLLGFFAGIGATILLTAMANSASTATAIAAAGMLTAFVAPFAGLVHAKLRGPIRRRTQRLQPGGAPAHYRH